MSRNDRENPARREGTERRHGVGGTRNHTDRRGGNREEQGRYREENGRGYGASGRGREDRGRGNGFSEHRREERRPYARGERAEVPGGTQMEELREDSRIVEGRNAVLEAFRSGKTIDRLMIQDGSQDGPMQTIRREAKKHGTVVDFVSRDRLDQISPTGVHQGVIAYTAAYEYAEVEDILAKAKEKGEPPFLILLDDIEDPHNLGAIIRTANLAGAHGVIIPKRRAVGLTATVARTSAGALNYTPVARVTNIGATIEELKKEGIWFVCADMDGEVMYRQNLTGPIGLVIGNEGEGVGRLVKENCDFVAGIPMKGQINSLNASVAAGVLAYEIVRQRISQK